MFKLFRCQTVNINWFLVVCNSIGTSPTYTNAFCTLMPYHGVVHILQETSYQKNAFNWNIRLLSTLCVPGTRLGKWVRHSCCSQGAFSWVERTNWQSQCNVGSSVRGQAWDATGGVTGPVRCDS